VGRGRSRSTCFVVKISDGFNVLPVQMALVLDAQCGARPDVGKDGALQSSLPWLLSLAPFQADVLSNRHLVSKYFFFQLRF